MITKRISLSIAAFLSISLILTNCSVNKAKIDNDLKKYFDEKQVDGCFTMLNNSTGEITVYNMAMDTARFAPGNTFHLFNAMIALQTGVLANESMIVKWDSVSRPNKDWNKDVNVSEAFQLNHEPFFNEIAGRTGATNMQGWINQVGYGNKKMDTISGAYWNNNSLAISPDEQLGLLKRLYFKEFKQIRQSVQESVNSMLVKENNSAYTLAYQTAEVKGSDGREHSWVIGWIEENRHIYFFATLVKAKQSGTDVKATGMNITKSILSHYGFFKGEK